MAAAANTDLAAGGSTTPSGIQDMLWNASGRRNLSALPATPMFTRILICLCLLVPCALHAADLKPYPLATCIVSGDKLDPTVPALTHNGQQVRFCCKACVKKFQANPDKYLIKLPKR